MTGAQVLLLVVSETGLVYTFATPKLQPIVAEGDGRASIQAYLSTSDSDLSALVSVKRWLSPFSFLTCLFPNHDFVVLLVR